MFHNAALHTPEALPNIIEKLQSDGYKIVPVSEIIMKENFKVDSTGRQISTEGQTPPSAAPSNSIEPTISTAPSSPAEPSSSTQPTSDAQISETPTATDASESSNSSASASTVSKILNN